MENMQKIRIIDMANVIAGPFCASILGDFGADVIKVEMPGRGDSARTMGPQSHGVGMRWHSLGRNKKSITLDFHQPKAIEIFLKLVEKSDVIIENYRTGTLDKWGLDMDTLRKANPDIIVTRITGYGQTGPNKNLSGFGSAVTAFSGVTYISGYEDKPPISPPFPLCDYVAGLYATIGTLIALINRKSQEIDVSLYESLFRMQDAMLSRYHVDGAITERGSKAGKSVPSGVFMTKDSKWVSLATSSDKAFAYLCAAMQRPDLAEKYPAMADRFANTDYIVSETTIWFANHTWAEIKEACDREKAVVCLLYSIEDIVNDPHYQARNTIREFPDEVFGTFKMPGVVPILSETPGDIKWMGPKLGSSNDEIYKGLLGMSDEEIAACKETGVM